jgi:hypothetical protein
LEEKRKTLGRSCGTSYHVGKVGKNYRVIDFRLRVL